MGHWSPKLILEVEGNTLVIGKVGIVKRGVGVRVR